MHRAQTKSNGDENFWLTWFNLIMHLRRKCTIFCLCRFSTHENISYGRGRSESLESIWGQGRKWKIRWDASSSSTSINWGSMMSWKHLPIDNQPNCDANRSSMRWVCWTDKEQKKHHVKMVKWPYLAIVSDFGVHVLWKVISGRWLQCGIQNFMWVALCTRGYT
jgi:hypothetical protein